MQVSEVTKNSLIDYVCDENQQKNEILRMLLKGEDVHYGSKLDDAPNKVVTTYHPKPRQ